MSIAESLNAVRDAAQILTRDGKVLTFASPEYPLAQFAETYNVDEAPTNEPMTDEVAVSVEDHFEEVNEDSLPMEDDSRESLVENVHLGLSKTLFTTNNVIIPAIKDMHNYFSGLQSRTNQPEYRVEPFIYADIHNSPGLVNHVNTRYAQVRPRPEYETFRLSPIGADQIITSIAVNNPHLEQEEVTEWALQMGDEKLTSVWNSLFGYGGTVNINALPYMTLQAAPFNVDEIALAYFICGHYIENPEQVPNSDVGIDDWTRVMTLLHECFGFYLGRAYLFRMDQRERGELILRNEATNPIETRRAVVIINNDVSAQWLLAGGDIQAILGAAVDNPGITLLEQIEKGSEGFIKRWVNIYPLIKQAAIDFSDRMIRDDVISTFMNMARAQPLKEMPMNEVDVRMQGAMRQLSRDDLRNSYKTFATLIVEVYFPNSNYKLFLEAIDEYGQDFPEATMRELNTQAIITLTAIFLAKQIKVEGYIASIGETPMAVDHGAVGAEIDFDEGVVAVAMDEEDAPVAPDLVVEGVETETDINEVEETEFGGEAEVVDTEESIEEPLSDDDSDFETAAEDEEPDPYADLAEPEETEEADEDVKEMESEEEESEATETEEEATDEEENPLV